MPELPEVESLRRILARTAIGRTIARAEISEPRLRRRVAPEMVKALAGKKIERISRRAKYLLIELGGGTTLLVHLGMSGSLTHRGAGFDSKQFAPRHDHVRFLLDDGSALVFNDPRRFGLIKVVPTVELGATPELSGLGPEPLSREFSAEYLAAKARGRSAAIKNVIMDQRIVAGIGNIYASEILFRAGVRPSRRAGKVSRAEAVRIVNEARIVLRAAIGSNGTTFRSYRDSRGRPGRFAERLNVYGRDGKPCPRCSTTIRNVTIGQRASFYCPKCQH
jgi:formamidopyrimidine-DNA glycosylase